MNRYTLCVLPMCPVSPCLVAAGLYIFPTWTSFPCRIYLVTWLSAREPSQGGTS
jgi:hypothetical protein